jgi:hypothetical protein
LCVHGSPYKGEGAGKAPLLSTIYYRYFSATIYTKKYAVDDICRPEHIPDFLQEVGDIKFNVLELFIKIEYRLHEIYLIKSS